MPKCKSVVKRLTCGVEAFIRATATTWWMIQPWKFDIFPKWRQLNRHYGAQCFNWCCAICAPAPHRAFAWHPLCAATAKKCISCSHVCPDGGIMLALWFLAEHKKAAVAVVATPVVVVAATVVEAAQWQNFHPKALLISLYFILFLFTAAFD